MPLDGSNPCDETLAVLQCNEDSESRFLHRGQGVDHIGGFEPAPDLLELREETCPRDTQVSRVKLKVRAGRVSHGPTTEEVGHLAIERLHFG